MKCPPFADTAFGAATKAARTTQIDNHPIRASRCSKRSGQKCKRTEIENSAYGEDNIDGETKLDQSIAERGGYLREGLAVLLTRMYAGQPGPSGTFGNSVIVVTISGLQRAADPRI